MADEQRPDADEELELLRELILGTDRDRLATLEERLLDAAALGDEVAEALPKALADADPEMLASALAEPLESATRRSVRAQPQALADALFPVMGPAIRKSIVETVRAMFESTNRAIERSLSWQGIRWRLEARRTGKSFAEIALLHSLVFRVEQLFLIHRETGLVLRHVTAPEVESQDADMVSGMLTAIRDFVADSFGVEGSASLDEMQVGDLRVLVQDGPFAVLAAVVRGEPPRSLRLDLGEAIERVHRHYHAHLADFDGDTENFGPADALLEPCLQSREQEADPGSRRTVRWAWGAAIALIVVLLCAWGVVRWTRAARWETALDRLDAAPGITVSAWEWRNGLRHVTGLRDEFSRDPDEILRESGVDPAVVLFDWEPYQSLHDELIARRLAQTLEVPASAALEVRDGVAVLTGEASRRWTERAVGLLEAGGLVKGYDMRDLIVAGDERIADLEARIEETSLLMELDSTELRPESAAALDELGGWIDELVDLAARAGEPVRITVSGHTDRSGGEMRNQALSLQRAEQVVAWLSERGLNAELFEVRGVGAQEYIRLPSDPVTEARVNRRVSFTVMLDEGGSSRVP